VLRFTGTPCTADDVCKGWVPLDNDPRTTVILAGGDRLYQLRQEQGELRRTERRQRPLGMAAARR
jgi:hypothetical protein